MIIKVIDLFAGCGGLSDGFFKTNNFDMVCVVEWNRKCCETQIHNITHKFGKQEAEKRVINFDIQDYKKLINGWKEEKNYPKHFYSKTGIKALKKEYGQIDLIIGGPPCQAYSLAGRVQDKNGMKDDYRNYLFESYIKIVDYFRPLALIFENVPGMLSAKPGRKTVTEKIRKSFGEHGYEIIEDIKKYAVFNCADFGVPQNRKRVILLGLRKDVFGQRSQKILKKFYTEIMPSLKKTGKNVRQAIGDLPSFFPKKLNGKISYFPSDSDIPNHKPRFHNKRDMNIFKTLAEDIQSGKKKYTSPKILKQLYTKKTGKKSSLHKYSVLRWDQPSTTIVAHLHKDGLRHIHPDSLQARSITPREAARLQSFDDDFIFLGSQSDQYKMIGDAVPPLFSKALAVGVDMLLTQETKQKIRQKSVYPSMELSLPKSI
ncbi:Modification methylase HaeIII [subsurface metagenome]